MDYRVQISPAMVEQAKTNPEMFGHIYDILYQPIFGYILKRCQDHPLALDITAETFLKALKNIRHFSPRKNVPFSAWVFTIAKNELNMYFRKSSRYTFSELVEYPELIQSHKDILLQLENDNRAKAVHHMLTQLKTKDQQLVQLRFFEEKSYSEISSITHMSEVAIRSRICRAINRLRILLQQENI